MHPVQFFLSHFSEFFTFHSLPPLHPPSIQLNSNNNNGKTLTKGHLLRADQYTTSFTNLSYTDIICTDIDVWQGLYTVILLI